MSKQSVEDAIRDEMNLLESSSYGVVRKSILKKDVLNKLGFEFYKSKEQYNYLRFVPPVESVPKFFGMKLFVHYNVGPNGDAYLCPKMMQKEYCPMCEKREALQAQEQEAPLDLLQKYGWTLRYLFWVVDVTNEDSETKGTQVYVAPKSMVKDMLSLCVDERTKQVMDVSDPETGQMFVFKRTGKTRNNTSYGGFKFKEDKSLLPEWCKVPKFEDILNFATAKDIQESMYVVSDNADASENNPRSRSRDHSRNTDETAQDAPMRDSEPEPEPEPTKEKSRSRSRQTTEETPKGRSRTRETDENEQSDSLDDIGKKAADRLARLKEDN